MKVVVADFLTNNIGLVKQRANQDTAIDKEVGRLLFHFNGNQAQYFIAEELSSNQSVVDLLVKAFYIVFLYMEKDGIIKDLKVSIHEIAPEDFSKYNVE